MLEPSTQNAVVRRDVDEEAGVDYEDEGFIEPKENVDLLQREPWSACSIL